MRYCTACGHPLGDGRFCTNCGARISSAATPEPVSAPPSASPPADPPADPPTQAPADQESPVEKTVVRKGPWVPSTPPATRPVPPASPPQAPTSSSTEYGGRFPLFADEAPGPRVPGTEAGPRAGSVDADEDAGPGGAGSTSELPAFMAGRGAAPSAVPPDQDAARRDVSPYDEPTPPAAPAGGGDLLPWTHERTERRRRGLWPVFVGIAVMLLLAVLLGGWLVLGGSDNDATAQRSAPTHGVSGQPSGSGGGPSESASAETPAAPVPPPANPQELAGSGTASAPVTAPANVDLEGNRVSYAAGNMLDGQPTTAWRMEGDGSGQTLTFTLPSQSVVTKVGLVNGYAKSDRSGGRVIHWYNRNRKVTQVTWIFDDGTSVSQSLRNTERMQSMAVGPVRTATIRLRLDTVSAPGPHDGRNDTPISEVSILGG